MTPNEIKIQEASTKQETLQRQNELDVHHQQMTSQGLTIQHTPADDDGVKNAALLPHELYQIAEKEKPSKLRPNGTKIRDSPSCYEPPKSRSSLRSQINPPQPEAISRKSEN